MINEFDKLLRKRFDETTLEFEPRQWDKMNAILENRKNPGKMRFWLIFSASAMAASLAFAFGIFYHPGTTRSLQAPAPHAVAMSQPAQQSIKTEDAPLIQHISALADPRRTQPATHGKSVAAISGKTLPKVTQVTNQYTAQSKEAETSVKETSIQETIAGPTRPVRNKSLNPEPRFYPEPAKALPQTAFSLAGGVNYGSLNTGYSLGVSARTKVGKKFYLEGDLAYNSNNTSATDKAEGVTSYNSVSSGGTSGISDVSKYERITTLNSLSYLQFTPSLGYQVTQKVSLSVGADLQKLITNKEDEIFIGDEGSEKLVPGFDYGITGKTEIAISKRLSAGLLYREGINNILRSSSGYFDRRYVQVQFKFRVLEK